jgi:hypothetical protein
VTDAISFLIDNRNIDRNSNYNSNIISSDNLKYDLIILDAFDGRTNENATGNASREEGEGEGEGKGEGEGEGEARAPPYSILSDERWLPATRARLRDCEVSEDFVFVFVLT